MRENYQHVNISILLVCFCTGLCATHDIVTASLPVYLLKKSSQGALQRNAIFCSTPHSGPPSHFSWNNFCSKSLGKKTSETSFQFYLTLKTKSRTWLWNGGVTFVNQWNPCSIQFRWICLPARSTKILFQDILRNDFWILLLSKYLVPWYVYKQSHLDHTEYHFTSLVLASNMETTKKLQLERKLWTFSVFTFSLDETFLLNTIVLLSESKSSIMIWSLSSNWSCLVSCVFYVKNSSREQSPLWLLPADRKRKDPRDFGTVPEMTKTAANFPTNAGNCCLTFQKTPVISIFPQNACVPSLLPESLERTNSELKKLIKYFACFSLRE